MGGGISDIEDIRCILAAGADKVSLNSSIVKDPEIINRCAEYFGSQCIVAALDAKKIDGDYYIFINAGKKNTGLLLKNWAKEVAQRGAGEILLTSMDADGTQKGFDIDMLNLVCDLVDIPVIASGGAGPDPEHFIRLFKETKADAGLAASIFHFDTLPVRILKEELLKAGVETRKV